LRTQRRRYANPKEEIRALNGGFVKEFNWPMALYLTKYLNGTS